MYILKIIPIAEGLPEKYFSYFSKEEVGLGDLVEIKIKNRKIFGIVKDVTDLKEEKINIKNHKFILRKIERAISKNLIKKELLKSIEETSVLLGCEESEIYFSYISNSFINTYIENMKNEKTLAENKHNKKEKLKAKVIDIILEKKEKRYEKYKSLIQKNISRKESINIFFPTINDLETFKKYIEPDHKNGLITLHSLEKEKEVNKNEEKLLTSGGKIILSTPSIIPFILKDKINLKTIIIEKENSSNYFSHSAKRQIDAREIIKKLGQDLSLDIYLGGNNISLGSYARLIKKKDLKEISRNKVNIIDMTKEDKLFETKYNRIYFSKYLIKKLEELKNQKEGKVFLYTKRKGLFTETVCRDCNNVLKCENCAKPYILFKNKDKREYICPNCKNKILLSQDEEINCKNCNSWRLETLGVGSQGIEANLKELGWKCFVLDAHNVKTRTKAKEIIEKWQKEKLSILIGTDLALNFINLNTKVDLASIISIDSLFSIPEINMDEKIINLILDIEEKMEREVILETRLVDNAVFKYIYKGKILEFLEDELRERKILSLPPFYNILKFKIENKNENLKNNIEKMIKKIWKEENVEEIKINWKQDKSKKTYIGMMIIKRGNWEIKKEGITLPTEFAKKIHTLLVDFRLEVNPGSVY